MVLTWKRHMVKNVRFYVLTDFRRFMVLAPKKGKMWEFVFLSKDRSHIYDGAVHLFTLVNKLGTCRYLGQLHSRF